MPNKYLLSLVILISLAALIYNLFIKVDEVAKYSDLYGKGYNNVREELRLPEIGKDWKILKDSHKDTITWLKDRFVRDTVPFHYYKEVIIKNDSIFSERDVFHYETNRKVAYRISCIYNYKHQNVKCKYIKYFKESYPPNNSFEVDLVFVDSVLTQWGLPTYYK